MSTPEDTATALAEMRGTPEQATAALAAMTAAYRGAPPPDVPTDAAGAAARLELLASDKDWGTRVLRNDVTAKAEFARLTQLSSTLSETELAMIGHVPSGYVHFNSASEAGLPEMAVAAADLLAVGISPDSIRQLLDDREVSAEEHRAVKHLHDQRFSDKAWTDRYMSGDQAARREATLQRFEVDLRHPTTGERRQVVVELEQAEYLDAMRILDLRGPRGPGGPDGPVAKGYAAARASKQLPDFHFVAIRPAVEN
jgi:hypothetical protein